jgi:hypothetical protein
MGSQLTSESLLLSSECVTSSPTTQYLDIVLKPSIRLVQPSPKLIILDLNKTLVYRKIHSIVLRPFLKEFVNYLFTDNNFLVMVWTSAGPKTADIIVNAIFGEQKKNLIVTWGCDKFDLTKEEYKNLDIVWNFLNPQIANGNFKNISSELILDPTNTILIDDSKYKTQMQPFNAIHPCEFNRKRIHNGDDSELKKIIEYLEVIKYQSNVAAYMKKNPFFS